MGFLWRPSHFKGADIYSLDLTARNANQRGRFWLQEAKNTTLPDRDEDYLIWRIEKERRDRLRELSGHVKE